MKINRKIIDIYLALKRVEDENYKSIPQLNQLKNIILNVTENC